MPDHTPSIHSLDHKVQDLSEGFADLKRYVERSITDLRGDIEIRGDRTANNFFQLAQRIRLVERELHPEKPVDMPDDHHFGNPGRGHRTITGAMHIEGMPPLTSTNVLTFETPEDDGHEPETDEEEVDFEDGGIATRA